MLPPFSGVAEAKCRRHSVSTITVVSTQTSETFAAHGCQRSLTRPQAKCRDVFKRIFAHTAFRASQALPCSVCNNVYASTPCDLQHIAGYSPAMRITLFHPCVEEGFSFVLVGGKGISLVALTVLRFSPNRGLSPQALPGAAGVASPRCSALLAEPAAFQSFPVSSPVHPFGGHQAASASRCCSALLAEQAGFQSCSV